MKLRYDKTILGVIAGIIAPLVVFFLIFAFKYIGSYTISEIFTQIEELGLTSKIIALCVFLSNLLLFYIMYRLRWDRFCKGILLATFIYAFLVISIKYL